MLRLVVSSAAVLGLIAAAPGGGARAQDRDIRPLLERIDRIERDMNMMQRQVYRGGGGGGPMPMASVDGNAALNAEIRMDQLENQMRGLTGQLEEINYNLDQLRRRLDKLVGDVDQRFAALERAAPSDSAAAAGAAAAGTAPIPVVPPAPAAGRTASATGAGANPAAPASQSGVLAVPPGGAARGGAPSPAAQPPQQQATAPATANPALPGGSAQDQYNHAFGLLRQADYPAAEQALRAFVQRFPNDPLAGNAQYWLGETYYVRGDFNSAAAAFAEGYKRYPQSGKGSDNLLKLGMSLGKLGQKEQACASLNQIGRDYPNVSTNIKERATAERRNLGC